MKISYHYFLTLSVILTSSILQSSQQGPQNHLVSYKVNEALSQRLGESSNDPTDISTGPAGISIEIQDHLAALQAQAQNQDRALAESSTNPIPPIKAVSTYPPLTKSNFILLQPNDPNNAMQPQSNKKMFLKYGAGLAVVAGTGIAIYQYRKTQPKRFMPLLADAGISAAQAIAGAASGLCIMGGILYIKHCIVSSIAAPYKAAAERREREYVDAINGFGNHIKERFNEVADRVNAQQTEIDTLRHETNSRFTESYQHRGRMTAILTGYTQQQKQWLSILTQIVHQPQTPTNTSRAQELATIQQTLQDLESRNTQQQQQIEALKDQRQPSPIELHAPPTTPVVPEKPTFIPPPKEKTDCDCCCW